MKNILIFAPRSPHTAKFINMIKDDINYKLVLDETGLDVDMLIPYTSTRQRSLKGLLTIIKNLWFTKHDYVHVQSLNLTALIVSIFAIKPIIVTAWGSDVLIVPNRSRINKLITQFILWRASKITANDSNNMWQAIKRLIDKPVIPIHFGVSKESIRAMESVKQNIIYSPRGHADLYNIDKVIEAFKVFSKNNPDWKLIVSGMQSANTPKLKEQAAGFPVIFTGWIPPEEHAKWNASAKIVVSIPSSDALSVTVMEAVYSNCICFVSDLLPNREVIIQGLNGFIGMDFERYKEIDFNNMSAHNALISKDWTFEHNKKAFLELYK